MVKMLGGVSDFVVQHAQGSVAVVPEQADEHPGAPVVLGLDDSPQGRLAMARAFQAASLRRVPLVVITAWDYGPYDAFNAEIWAHSMAEMNQMMVEEAEKLIADKVAEFPDVDVTIEPVRGRPETALVEASKDAGLLVIGSKGRGASLRCCWARPAATCFASRTARWSSPATGRAGRTAGAVDSPGPTPAGSATRTRLTAPGYSLRWARSPAQRCRPPNG